MTDTGVTCGNRQCHVADDGKCLEGYAELGKCPHYGREPEEDGEDGEGEDQIDADFDGVRLPDARALGLSRANRVLADLPSRVIGVIGVYDSGKTSLIAGLFDLFQVGPVADVRFAGSSTLHGFELVCHEARVTSGRDEADSPRTARGEVRFYHLDVLEGGGLRSLLIADRSGEEYEEVADLAANATAMFELRRADVITVLVDGRRLASPVERADTMGAIPLIIQGMVENGAFTRRPDLAIVLTKDDVVQASPRRERVEQDFGALVDTIRESFADSFGDLRSFVTCASPTAADAERGRGIAAVLQFWLRPRAPVEGQRLRFRSGRVFDGLMAAEADDG